MRCIKIRFTAIRLSSYGNGFNSGVNGMKTIEVSIDERLLKEVDQTVYKLQMTRTEFIHKALIQTLRQYQLPKLEEQDAVGYVRRPVQPDEVEEWAAEQVWGDEWKRAFLIRDKATRERQ
jgi:hypothetical protein